LHPRGNFEGFVQAASRDKWLEAHGIEHWTHFYTDYGVGLQKRFFNYFLKGEKNGWGQQPPVQLQVRHVDRFVERHENEWPLARTQWTRLYLDPVTQALTDAPVTASATVEYDAMGDGITFVSPPLPRETEITGPSAAKLFISSSTQDADLFLVFRVFAPDFKEVVFQGAIDPHTPVAQGWLRASHRRLDKKLSTPWRPYHVHDHEEPLKRNQIVELDIELWPTSIVVPAGCRLALSVRGNDYVYPGGSGSRLTHFKNELTGCGPFLHNDSQDRPAKIFDNKVTLHAGPQRQAYLLLPVIPQASKTGGAARKKRRK
jgi:uncharacterized protein